MENKKMHYAWLIFIACCAMSFVGLGLMVNTEGLFFVPIGKELKFSRSELSLMLTIQNIAAMISMPITGKMFNKIKTKYLLTGSFGFMAVGFVLLSRCSKLYMFYGIFTIIGLAMPAAMSAPTVLLANWFEKKLGFTMGIAMALSGLAGAIFNPLVSSIIVGHGWRTAYIFIAVAALIIVLPFTLFIVQFKPSDKGLLPYGVDESKKTSGKPVEQTGMTAKEAYRTAPFYLFCAAMIVLQAVAGLVQHVSAHVVNEGFSLTVGATVISGIMLGAAAGKFIIGLLLDKVPSKLVVIIYGSIGFIGWLGLNLALSSKLLIASGFVLGLGQALMLVALPFFIRKVFGTKEYSYISSIIGVCGSLASAVSVYADGVIFDMTKTYKLALSLNLVYYVVAMIVIIVALTIGDKMKKAVTSDK